MSDGEAVMTGGAVASTQGEMSSGMATGSQESNVQPFAADPPQAWEWAEGVPGSGEPPEWFNTGTFKNIAAQAESYSKMQSEVSKKLAGFSS